MKKALFLTLLLTINFSTTTLASNFTVCLGKYALCTTALCTPIPGKQDLVACTCKVESSYSAGTTSCQQLKSNTTNQVIYSRYFPIQSYVRCSNSRPWAWCLDKPCVINKNDPTTATCSCTLVANKGTYIIVTNTINKSTCTTGTYSSATITDVNQITDFLKSQPQLPPYPIKVFDSP